jgi:hypothetical protein
VNAQRTASEWPLRPLEAVTERIFLGLADTRQRGDGDERELPVLTVRDLQGGHVPPAAALTKRAVPAGANVERYTVRANDILLTSRGALLKVANVAAPTEGALISANLIAIRAGAGLLPAVLLAFLQSAPGQNALRQRVQSSGASIMLTPKVVGGLSIPIPPLAVQHQIAELVSTADQHYRAATRAAEQRRALAHAVASELFRGKPQPGHGEPL